MDQNSKTEQDSEQKSEVLEGQEDLAGQKSEALEGQEDLAKLKEYFQQEILAIKENMKNLAEDFDRFGSHTSSTISDETTEKILLDVLAEIKDREFKKRCLFIFDLPESDESDRKARDFADRQTIENIFVEAGVNNVRIVSTRRGFRNPGWPCSLSFRRVRHARGQRIGVEKWSL